MTGRMFVPTHDIVIGKTRRIPVLRIHGHKAVWDWLLTEAEFESGRRSDTDYALSLPSESVMSLGVNMVYGALAFTTLKAR